MFEASDCVKNVILLRQGNLFKNQIRKRMQPLVLID